MEEVKLDEVLNYTVFETSLLFREMLSSDNSGLLWASIFAYLEQCGLPEHTVKEIHKMVIHHNKEINNEQ